jgi:hypothetical protein
MQCEWLGERVATVDITRAISNVLHNKEDAGWGPNAVFRFPKQGGTGAIWKGVAALLPAENQVSKHMLSAVVEVVQHKQHCHLMTCQWRFLDSTLIPAACN